MAMLTMQSIAQSFGATDLFSGVSGNVANDGKVGLVGPNGVGKTTLLRILAGFDEPSGGKIHIAKGTRIGYLRQEAIKAFAGRENSVWDEMLTVFDEVRATEGQLQKLEAKMASSQQSDNLDTLLEEYSSLQAKFEATGGYDYELRIKQVLGGLGFQQQFYDQPLSILSGGQKTRALLARLLLEKPDLLILDEPTNHLDIQAVEWLEATLKAWEGAILIVSHDRYFLDKVVNAIWELRRDGLETFRGNYSHYVQQREERWDNRQRLFDEMIETFMKELDYIKRNIARDSTKNMAVGRLKRLIRQVKMAQVGGAYTVLKMDWAKASELYNISGAKWEVPDVERAIKTLPRPSGRLPEMTFQLNAKQRSGELVLRTKELAVGYNGVALFDADDITLHRQECAALIGPNGSGKTTFLKTLLEKLEPVHGAVTAGASLNVGYFAQAHDGLDPEKRVIDELLEHKPNLLIPEARNYLGRFLFRGDDVFKPVSLLSGGERGRLALAKLSLEDANFLLLDEPTNHLDIPAQEALQAVLGQFDGTILMVTHDRYLVNALASQVWEVRENRLQVYNEGYAGYLSARNREKDAAKEATKQVAKKRPTQNQTSGPSAADQPPAKPTLSKNEIRRRKLALTKLEDEIADAELAIEQAEKQLQEASNAQDFTQIKTASEAYEKQSNQLTALMELWEQVAGELAEGNPA